MTRMLSPSLMTTRSFAAPRDGCLEALAGEWLEDVIHRVQIEGLNREPLERGDEHDVRTLGGCQRANDVEAGEAGHGYVEESGIWCGLSCANLLECFEAVAAECNDADAGHGGEPARQSVQRGRLVVRDQNTKLAHHAGCVASRGMRIVTRAPRPASRRASHLSDAAAP